MSTSIQWSHIGFDGTELRAYDHQGKVHATATPEQFVRCVNSHEALVQTLQQARKWIREQMADNGCPEDRLDNPPAGSHLANIEAALAAAGTPQ